ncbi:MAG: hypothetical protein JO336_16155 [Acidobacteriia bacterium]|nr:hypothetical protein [Terriglobia bacterium]
MLLHVESPGIDDDFFSLGGNSMVAAQVVAQIRNTFGIELSLHALSEAPTIADLAGRVKSGVATNHLKTPSRGT